MKAAKMKPVSESTTAIHGVPSTPVPKTRQQAAPQKKKVRGIEEL